MEFCRPSRFISEIDSNYIHNNEADIRTGTDSAKWGRASNMFTNRHVKVSHFTNENLVSKKPSQWNLIYQQVWIIIVM